MAERELSTYSDKELSRPAMTLAKRFVQRWDIHARQLNDGRYICVHEPLNVSHLFAHLRGEITLGTYLLSPESEARFIVLDADDEQRFSRLIQTAQELAKVDIPAYPETSRRGGHLWIFFEKGMQGNLVRQFGQGVLDSHEVDGVELYPKQDRLGAGPGSLIRMPVGVHLVSRQRYDFLNPFGGKLAATTLEQILLLSEPQTIPETAFESYRSLATIAPPLSVLKKTEAPSDIISERIKSSITVLEFISQYMDLKTPGSGAIGLCPFHDDRHPSFGVNDDENYWYCFAGCGGGSLIDFWMKWQGCDFTTAVTELASMLL